MSRQSLSEQVAELEQELEDAYEKIQELKDDISEHECPEN